MTRVFRWFLRIALFLLLTAAYVGHRTRPDSAIESDLAAALGEGLIAVAYVYLLFYILALILRWFTRR